MCEKWQIQVKSSGPTDTFVTIYKDFCMHNKTILQNWQYLIPKRKHNIYDFFPFPALVPSGKTQVEKLLWEIRIVVAKKKPGLVSNGGLE